MSRDQWLYLDDPMQYGAAVRRWQELCGVAGYSLKADGWFGPMTDVTTREIQSWLGVVVDGIVGPKTIEAMVAKTDKDQEIPDTPPPTDTDGVEIIDHRGIVPWPKNGKYLREWSQISGVMLHRTACVLGEKPERWYPVNCHIGVTLEGKIILPHKWELMIWHGHYPSQWTIGIEFDGNPEGFPGYHWTPGGGPHEITDAQVKAGWVLLDMLTDAFEANGRKLKYIYAHKLSSDQRECDPGWEAWQKIAMPWMEKTGAVPGDVGWQGTTFGSGFHINQQWDERSPVKGYRVR
jgi:peptidoglycan hydrolase-like protein with peptidoglycan-binding domain